MKEKLPQSLRSDAESAVIQNTIISNEVIIASERDRVVFFDALNSDNPPNEKLIKAAAFYREFMECNKSN